MYNFVPIIHVLLQVGVFPKLSGEEYEKYTALSEKLRSDYDFGHTTDAKLLPRGESSVTGPLVRLFKPFDELVVDFKVPHTLKKFRCYVTSFTNSYNFDRLWQDILPRNHVYRISILMPWRSLLKRKVCQL